MSTRNIQFANGEYYHVFNRGVDKRNIFMSREQQVFFFNRLRLLNTDDSRKYIANQRCRYKGRDIATDGDRLVSIVAYNLLPNHFHLLLRQLQDDGISKYMHRLSTSYTMHFNQEEERSGALFQGRFKATHLRGDMALPILSAYVNLNHKHHQIDPNKFLVKSSFDEYCREQLGESICGVNEMDKILDEVGGLSAYKAFAKQCSMTFALNKNTELTSKDFEF